MNDQIAPLDFWKDETCEYCGGPIEAKYVTLHRHVNGQYVLFEHVPAGVCKECGTRYYAANVLKRIEQSLHGHHKAVREVLVPVYSV